MKAIFVTVCVSVLFLGCARKPPSALDDRRSFELIKVGMTKQEVHKLLGKPRLNDLINPADKGGSDYYGSAPKSDPLGSPDSPTSIVIEYSDDDIVRAKWFFCEPSDDENEVRVAASEYVITNDFGTGATGRIYVAIDDKQLESLKARLPRRDIRGRRDMYWAVLDGQDELSSKIVIRVDDVKMNGSVAGAEATWWVNRSSMTYALNLSKTSGWTVTNAWVLRASIADKSATR